MFAVVIKRELPIDVCERDCTGETKIKCVLIEMIFPGTLKYIYISVPRSCYEENEIL